MRVIFKESIIGPSPKEIYVDEEIAAERKAEGYDVNLVAEMEEVGRDYNVEKSEVESR